MKLSRLFFSFAVLACALPCLAQYPEAWSAQKELGQNTRETPRKILPAPGGGFFICGSDYASATIAKITDSGAVQWSKAIEGNRCDMAVSPAGVAVVGGLDIYPDQYSNFFSPVSVIQRYDLQGNLLWSKSLAWAQGPPEARVAVDNAGNVIVLFVDVAKLKKYDSATGNEIFTVDGPYTFIPSELAIDSAGATYVASEQSGPILTKYSATGTVLWSKSHEGHRSLVRIDGGGNPYFVFSALTGTQVYKYDPAGNVTWNSSAAQPVDPVAFAVSGSGSVTVTGLGFGSGVATRFGSSGQFLWTKGLASQAVGVAVDSAGSSYAVSEDGPDKALITKFDTAGTVLWSAVKASSLSGNYGPTTLRIVVDPVDRPILLYPSTSPLTSQDLALQAFSTTGAEVWSLAFDDKRSFDQALNSVTDSSGNTYAFGIAIGGSRRAGLVKFSSGGGVSWSRILPAFVGDAIAVSPRLAPGGGVVVGQYYLPIYESEPYAGMSVHRYDPSGNLVWTYSSSAGGEQLLDISVASDGSACLLIGLQSPGSTQYLSFRVRKLDSLGKVAWTVDRPGLIYYTFLKNAKTAIDSSGAVYVAVPVGDTKEVALTKYSALGTPLWSSSVAGENDGLTPEGISFDSQGSPYLLADSTFDSARLCKYSSSNGGLLWDKSLGDYKEGMVLVIDVDDNVFVCGHLQDTARPNVVKLNVSGGIQWSTAVGTQQPNAPFRMISDKMGGVIIGCHVLTNNYPDTQIARIASDGSLPWPSSGGAFVNKTIRRNSGTTKFRFAGLGSDSFGNLFVAGSSFAPSGSYDMSVVKYAAGNSELVSQTLTSSMVAGQTYTATVTFKNTGFETWTKSAGYRLGVVNGATWGVTSVALGSGDAILPGQSKTFSFPVYAPITAGAYNLQCKLYKGGSSFGATSTSGTATVTVRQHAARYMSQVVPSSVKAGTTFAITVTMRNVGTNTWTQAAGYGLSCDPSSLYWGVSKVFVAPSDSVGQGVDKVFTFNVTAPSTPGSYSMRWQMNRTSVGFFGDKTGTRTITVVP